MKIMNLKEFSKTPNGTLFVEIYKNVHGPHDEREIDPNDLSFSEVYIKSGQHNRENFWTGVVNLVPDGISLDKSHAACNWCSWDHAISDFVDDDLFGVFEPNEIKAMISILTDGLNTLMNQDGHTNFASWNSPNPNGWYINNMIFDEQTMIKAVDSDASDFDYGEENTYLSEVIREYYNKHIVSGE